MTSRMLNIMDDDFDIDLNLLDSNEQDVTDKQLVKYRAMDIFDNTKRTLIGPR